MAKQNTSISDHRNRTVYVYLADGHVLAERTVCSCTQDVKLSMYRRIFIEIDIKAQVKHILPGEKTHDVLMYSLI